MALTPDKTAELDTEWEEGNRLRQERLAGSKQSYEASQKAADMAVTGKDAAMKNVAQEASRAVSSTIAATPAGSGLRLTAARGTALDRATKEGALGAELDAQIAAAQKMAGEAKKTYADNKIDGSTLAKRVEHVMQSSFGGKRIVVFSGGEAKGLDGLYEEIRGLRDGGANGSIIGRNTFQRPKKDALEMLQKIIDIYLGKF
jgi:class I fructose-bisphosphate aldolase